MYFSIRTLKILPDILKGKALLKFLVVFILPWIFPAQVIYALDAPDIFFKKINIENGLSHRKVNCILKDKRGFIWFGSEDGLNRYDGRYITYFRHKHNDSGTISGNIISDLYEDKAGIIWIATLDGGMTRYDYRASASKQFKQFRYNVRNKGGIPENGISKIVEDAYGYLWLGTSGNYAARFNKKTQKFDIPIKKGTKCVMSLKMGNRDTLWVGRAGGGLMKINTKTLTYSEDPAYDNLYAALPHASITSFFKDSKGGTWMGSWDNKVYRVAADGRNELAIGDQFQKNGIPKDDYVSFAEDVNGLIWMAGRKTGIAIYDQYEAKVFNLRHNTYKNGSLSDDHVNVVYKDSQGIIWVGTDNGVNMFNPLFSPFIQHHLPKADADILIYDFFKDTNGDLLIGTSNGIYIKKPGNGLIEHRTVRFKQQKLSVSKFFLDIDQQLYIGTDYTLFKYNQKNNQVSTLDNTESDPVMKKLIGSRIVSIIRDTLDNHPVLMVSPYGHYLTYYDLVEKKWYSRADKTRPILKYYNIKDNLIRKFYRDKHSNLWLANFKTGLGGWDHNGGDITYYINDLDNKHSLSSNSVYDLQEDRHGILWISTYGGGINYFNRETRRFHHVSESSNLSEGLEIDESDRLWMLCNGHVHKYDPFQKVYSCYDMPRLQNTGGVSGYLFKDNLGVFYAAGLNYYINFDPKKVAKIDHNPPIHFTDFKIFNTSYNQYLQEKVIKLDYDQDQITIDFAAPEYSGDNLTYSYKLEGHDRDWIDAGKRNTVSYANLKGGNYRFKVRASNWQGPLTEKVAELNIVIALPFWSRVWFYFFIFCLIAIIIYGIYRYRLNTLLKQQAIRNGIAQDLHDQIGSTLSSISVYGEVAKRYHEQGEQNRMNQILDTISLTANDMVSEMGDIVWAINPKNDYMESIMERIKSYAEPLCRATEINFIFNYDPVSLSSIVGMQTRKNLFLIMKEAINNAIKHSDCDNLIMKLRQVNNKTELVIRDDGKGFDIEAFRAGKGGSAGNGLYNIINRAEQLNAVIVQTSAPGIGTYLRIEFDNN